MKRKGIARDDRVEDGDVVLDCSKSSVRSDTKHTTTHATHSLTHTLTATWLAASHQTHWLIKSRIQHRVASSACGAAGCLPGGSHDISNVVFTHASALEARTKDGRDVASTERLHKVRIRLPTCVAFAYGAVHEPARRMIVQMPASGAARPPT